MAPADTAGRPPRPALPQILDDLLTPIDSIEENSEDPDALAETKRQIKERLQPLFQAANCVLGTNNNFSRLGAAPYPEKTQLTIITVPCSICHQRGAPIHCELLHCCQCCPCGEDSPFDEDDPEDQPA